MIKYLIMFCLFLSPLSLSAHLLKTDKFTILELAKEHKKKATAELYHAEDMTYLIPNLGDRKHMGTLISSAIAATAVSDPKGKLLTVGLALIASLANEMYDNYCEFCTHLYKASYHLEMYNFYNQLSVNFKSMTIIKDKGTEYFLKAIDCLTLIDMMCEVIDNEDTKIGISSNIIHERDVLFSHFNDNPGKLNKKLSAKAYLIYEESCEVLADISNEQLRDEMSGLIYLMYEYILMAEKAWGL